MAPIIYFDAAPNFGFNNGVASLTLEAVVYVNVGDQIRAERRVVAHLRMPPGGTVKANKYRRFSASNPARRVGDS